MKHIVLVVLIIAAFLALDQMYLRDLERVYEFNKWVIEGYCRR